MAAICSGVDSEALWSQFGAFLMSAPVGLDSSVMRRCRTFRFLIKELLNPDLLVLACCSGAEKGKLSVCHFLKSKEKGEKTTHPFSHQGSKL